MMGRWLDGRVRKFETKTEGGVWDALVELLDKVGGGGHAVLGLMLDMGGRAVLR